MKVVIIGAGVAGVTGASAVRELDPDCQIDIYTREPYLYYYRPRLPALVSGEYELSDIYAHPPDWYASRRINVHLSTTVASVDPEQKSVVLEEGERVPFDRLLIASGSDSFVPPVEGVGLGGVFSLRTADDALAIRGRADSAKRAVVVGGGLLGLEAAKALRVAGLEVTVIENAERLLPRQLDDGGASLLEAKITGLGIDVRTGATTELVEGGAEVSGVRLSDGTLCPCELTLFSTGVRSTTGFLEGSGIKTARGVVVGGDMLTSVPDVYAAGDVAEFEGVVWGIIPVAISQASTAGRKMGGDTDAPPAAAVPYNRLNIVGVDVFSAGDVQCSDSSCREYVEEDSAAGTYRRVLVSEGVVVGAIVIGSRKGASELNALIQGRANVGRWGDAIVREDFDFRRLDR
jgi:nitrite reductase (NADH) large subunit